MGQKNGIIKWLVGALFTIALAAMIAILTHFQVNKVDKGVYKAEQKSINEKLVDIKEKQREQTTKQEQTYDAVRRIEIKIGNP